MEEEKKTRMSRLAKAEEEEEKKRASERTAFVLHVAVRFCSLTASSSSTQARALELFIHSLSD